MAKAWLFDPLEGTATQIMVDGLQDYYNAIGCTCIDAVSVLDNTHSLFVDDEGLLKQDYHKKGFVVPFKVDVERQVVMDVGQPLVGRAVLIGFCQDSGESVDVTADIETIRHAFGWGRVTTIEDEDEEGMTGNMHVEPFTFQ